MITYTNGAYLQTFPVPEGPEWRVATQGDIDRVNAAMRAQIDAVIENEWRTNELSVIARQLEAIEEDEADETPPDLLIGTRKQWLSYRGKVSNWKEGVGPFPDAEHRPVRPV